MAGLVAGCFVRRKGETYPRWSKSERTRLYSFKNIETLGVAQVIDATGSDQLDCDAFGKAVAADLASRRRFHVQYPRDVAAALAAKGIDDPSKLSDRQLIEATRAAKLDALLVIRVVDFKPYYPPRISFKARLYATEIHGGLSAREILDWSDDGVPRDVPAALTNRFIWYRDELFDGHDKSTSILVRDYAMKHDQGKHPMGPEVFLRSMDRFFQFISYRLGRELYDDSLAYKRITREIQRNAARDEGDGYPAIAR